MSGAFKLLNGEVEDPRDEEIRQLREENDALQMMVRDSERAAQDAKQQQRDYAAALARLKRQLSPLYQALCQVFGDLDAAGVEDIIGPREQATHTRGSAVWDEWKARLGPGCTKVIDVLLLGGEMTIAAISIAGKMGKRQVYEATAKMGQVGILVRNGGKFSLKQF